MLAALRDGEGQLALQKRRADQASAAIGGHCVYGMHVGVAAAEGDDAIGVPACGLHQAIAMWRVVGNDRDAVSFQSREDLRLGIGDRLLRPEIGRASWR